MTTFMLLSSKILASFTVTVLEDASTHKMAAVKSHDLMKVDNKNQFGHIISSDHMNSLFHRTMTT